MKSLTELQTRLAEAELLKQASYVLGWDQQTYLPRGGYPARAAQMATLSALAHRQLAAPETGRLLEAAVDEASRESLDPESDEATLLRLTRRDLAHVTAVPEEFVAEVERTNALAYQAWADARARNDFAAYAPWLRQTFEHAQRLADYLGYAVHPYDALLDDHEPGMTLARLRPLFATLRTELVPLLRSITAQSDVIDAAVLYRTYDEAAQLRFAHEMAEEIGFDFTRGRLDLTLHPFASGITADDVRLTTRVDRQFFSACLMSVLHEAGHGLYEQGITTRLGAPTSTYLHSASMGMHESQSRLWENIVGRSRPFWTTAFPRLQRAFPGVLDDVDADTFYRALNKVAPSTIRVEADEVTYNLHIMLRFELEVAILDGDLRIEELPEAWNARMQEYLGITPPNDTEGVLQDVHWSQVGSIGYFPTYTIGNVLASQLYEAATIAHPSIPDEIERGQFATLLTWMRENIHRYGRRYGPDDLVQRATGHPLDTAPYLRYLRRKFGALYRL